MDTIRGTTTRRGLANLINALIGLLSSFTRTNGNIFFVNNSALGVALGAADDASASRGRTANKPFLTVDYAIGRCTASRGDKIIVGEGHVETLTGAAAVALDVAGVSIEGMGVGRSRPRFNYTTAIGASLNVTAANCRISNCVFTMIGFDAITAGINVSAADFVLDDCEVEFADATNQAVLALLTASGADRMWLKDCWFHGSADAGTATAIRIAAGKDIRIERCVIWGNFTTTLGGIDNSAAVVNLNVNNCKIANNTASAAKAIACHASTTGDLSDNIYRVLTGTAPVAMAAGYGSGRSYYTAAAGVAAGTLI